MDDVVMLDEVDRRILRVLRERADISNSELAGLVGLTPAPCLRRVARLKEDGIIQRSTIQIDNARLGYGLSALVEVTLERHNREGSRSFVEKIRRMPQVLACHMVTGEYDFMLRILVKDLDEYRRLVWETIYAMKGIQKMRTSVIFATYKDETNAMV